MRERNSNLEYVFPAKLRCFLGSSLKSAGFMVTAWDTDRQGEIRRIVTSALAHCG